MVEIVVEFKVKPENLVEFKSLLSSFSATCARQSGCISHTSIHHNGDPMLIIMFEKFKSNDDYQTHRAADYHVKFKQQTAPFILDKKVTVTESQHTESQETSK